VNFPPESGPFGQTEMESLFYVRWTGKLRIAQAGSYTFFLNSADGSRLVIDGRRVVDNDGLHDLLEKSGTGDLGQGDHDLELEYFSWVFVHACVLSWRGAGLSKQVVPSEVLFHEHGREPDTPLDPPDWEERTDRFVQVTNDSGQFQFNHLLPGRYLVRCHLRGRVEERAIGVSSGPQSVSFEVAPPKKGVWRNYTVADGVPSGSIHSLTFDTNGVMWFGTYGNGLGRFDGERFSNPGGDGVGRTSPHLGGICLDRSGAVWAMSEETGVFRLRGTN
jgi:hypothetical protein